MSLRVKLIAFFLLVGVVPLAAIGVLSYTMASQNIEDEVFSAIDMFAGITDSQLDDYFAERYGDGRVLATTRDVYQSMNILQATRAQNVPVAVAEPAVVEEEEPLETADEEEPALMEEE